MSSWIISAETTNWLSALGPWGASIAICVGAIAYLRRELALSQKRLEKVTDERLRIAEHVIPVVHSATETIKRSTVIVNQQSLRLSQTEHSLVDVQRTLEQVRDLVARTDDLLAQIRAQR